MPGNSEDECEYLRQRAERIRKNEEYLASLGLSGTKKKLMEITKATKRNARLKKRAQVQVTPGEERRSARLSSEKSKTFVMLSYEDEDDTNAVILNDDGDYEADEEPVYDYKPIRGRKYNVKREEWDISDEEKKVLTTVDENFLKKFKEFLIYHNKISDPNVRNVMRQVGKLARGDGIRYESPTYGWAEGCFFMKGTKVTPMSDIVQLMEEAQECEDKWGRDHGNGWLLSHPLKKLLLFQQFALNNPDFLTAKCKLSDYYAQDDDLDLGMDISNGPSTPTKAADSSCVAVTPSPGGSGAESSEEPKESREEPEPTPSKKAKKGVRRTTVPGSLSKKRKAANKIIACAPASKRPKRKCKVPGKK